MMSVLFKTLALGHQTRKREKGKLCSPMRPARLTGLGWLFIEAKRWLGSRSCWLERGGLVL